MGIRLADAFAVVAFAATMPAALAAVAGDEAGHQRYYNLHQRMVYGIRSGHLTAEEAEMASAGEAGKAGDPSGAHRRFVPDAVPGGMVDRESVDGPPRRPGAMRSDNS